MPKQRLKLPPHLVPSYVADAIREGAPRFGTSTPSTVVPLPHGKSKRPVQ
jgi:hypothetical protein